MENFHKGFLVRIAGREDIRYAPQIVDEMESSAKVRGTGIAKRSPEYVAAKMSEGKAVIAFASNGDWVGFCYIEAWSHGLFVANSGLIVAPAYRKSGIARRIKEEAFSLSRKAYPHAKIFGLTTGLAVMKINSDLGYEPVTYSELTDDAQFWAGCRSCVNYEILNGKGRKNCLCTAMLYDPGDHRKTEEVKKHFREKAKIYERLLRLKQHKFLKPFRKNKSTPVAAPVKI
jgi:GNAT superfamily N-acetyltransferase